MSALFQQTEIMAIMVVSVSNLQQNSTLLRYLISNTPEIVSYWNTFLPEVSDLFKESEVVDRTGVNFSDAAALHRKSKTVKMVVHLLSLQQKNTLRWDLRTFLIPEVVKFWKSFRRWQLLHKGQFWDVLLPEIAAVKSDATVTTVVS